MGIRSGDPRARGRQRRNRVCRANNMARTVMEQLIRYGEVRRGRLGFTIQDLTPALAAPWLAGGYARRGGVSDRPGSPAEKAGIKPGDVVLAVDGRPLRGSTDLRNQIGLARVGDEVELKLARDKKELTVRVRIAGRTDATASGEATPAGEASPAAQQALAGTVVQDIRPGMPMFGKVEGVVVVEVEPGSPAWSRGLRAGDIIIAINRKPVRNIAEFNVALGPHGTEQTERTLALDVLRGDRALFLVIG